MSKIGVIGFYSTQASEQIAAACSKIAKETPGLEIAHGDVVYGRAKLVSDKSITQKEYKEIAVRSFRTVL